MVIQYSLITSDSIKELQKISVATFKSAFEAQNNPKDFQNYLDTAFSEKSLLEELQTLGSKFYFAHNENEIVGYFKVNEFNAQTEFKEREGMELERIYVLSGYQSMGIGKQIVRTVENMASNISKSYLWLGVWERNLQAIKFYESLGFVKFGTHPYYIGKDKQTDWVMKKFL